MSDAHRELMPFRGGPLDGRSLWVMVTDLNREWWLPTVDGRWVGDLAEALPEDLSTIDYRHERYVRVGGETPFDGEYVHETLL
jgi:hypothetical protein